MSAILNLLSGSYLNKIHEQLGYKEHCEANSTFSRFSDEVSENKFCLKREYDLIVERESKLIAITTVMMKSSRYWSSADIAHFLNLTNREGARVFDAIIRKPYVRFDLLGKPRHILIQKIEL